MPRARLGSILAAGTISLLVCALAAPAAEAAPARGEGDKPAGKSRSRDQVPPTVTVDQAIDQPDPTNAASIHFVAQFSEPVTGFNEKDVSLGGTAPGSKFAVVGDSGDHQRFDVNVAGATGSGTVTVSIRTRGAQDAAGNANLASTSADGAVMYNAGAPEVTVDQAGSQADPTGTSTVHFTARFSSPVTGLDTGDVTLGGTAAGLKTVSISDSGDHRRFDIAVGGLAAPGTITATLDAGAAQDVLGNGNLPSTFTDNSVMFTGGAASGLGTSGLAPSASGALGIVADASGWGVNVVDQVASLGSVKWMREEVKAQFGAVVQRAKQYGINVLGLTYPDRLVRDVTAYPDVTWWEVDNEPYWSGVDPGAWAVKVKNAIIAARKANPSARFVVPMGADYLWNGVWKPWDQWLWEAVPDFGSYIDGWSVHPYCEARPPERWSQSEWESDFRRFEVIHDRLAARGVTVPGWLTEFGYPTGGAKSLSGATQAEYLRRAVQIARSDSYIQAIFLYHLRDWGTADTDREHYFGSVYERDGVTEKPAAAVIRAL
jgi:hypothetical protein